MFNKKSLSKKIAILGTAMFAAAMMQTPVKAATNGAPDISTGVSPAILAWGQHTQYPSEGGTWEYGFWNVKARSYYTVDRSHGSTVKVNDRESRSVDTASGYQSVAEVWAGNLPGQEDHYYYRVCD